MKHILKTLAFVVVFVMATTVSVFASQATISLETNGEKAGVRVTLPQESGNAVTAMELRIDVANHSASSVGFEFASNLNATVQESRYLKDRGELVIYIAGAKNVFQQDTAFLGNVYMDKQAEGSVDLSVKSNALQIADGIYGIVNSTVKETNAIITGQGSSSTSSSQPESSSTSSSSSLSNTGVGTDTPSSSHPNNKPASSKPASQSNSKNSSPSESESILEETESSSVQSSSSQSSSLREDSQSQSSSQSSSQTEQQTQKTDTTLWLMVGALFLIAVGAIAFIMIKRNQ